MYFYRLMSKEELQKKKIHNNRNNFYYYINTHKYKKNKKYIHLFLNAESCFEDFDKNNYDSCVIAKFDIPDEILFKYGIHLGGYSLQYNHYNKKYRYIHYRNAIGDYVFWLPEIAIEAKDFDYNWMVDICNTKNENGDYYLKESFITDDLFYQNIVYDGYLIGYNNEQELEEKYNQLLKQKQKIINVLKTTKNININPKDINNDSLLAVDILIDYGLKHQLINSKNEIKITLNSDINPLSINMTSDNIETDAIIINVNHKYSIPSFCATLYRLGFDIDKETLYSIHCEDNVIIEHSLIKK